MIFKIYYNEIIIIFYCPNFTIFFFGYVVKLYPAFIYLNLVDIFDVCIKLILVLHLTSVSPSWILNYRWRIWNETISCISKSFDSIKNKFQRTYLARKEEHSTKPAFMDTHAHAKVTLKQKKWLENLERKIEASDLNTTYTLKFWQYVRVVFISIQMAIETSVSTYTWKYNSWHYIKCICGCVLRAKM